LPAVYINGHDARGHGSVAGKPVAGLDGVLSVGIKAIDKVNDGFVIVNAKGQLPDGIKERIATQAQLLNTFYGGIGDSGNLQPTIYR
jgi:hypothetical protein